MLASFVPRTPNATARPRPCRAHCIRPRGVEIGAHLFLKVMQGALEVARIVIVS